MTEDKKVTDGRKRYAIVGVGARSPMYQDAINETYKDRAVLVGYCDNNLGRLKIAQKRALDKTGVEPPIYDINAAPDAYEKMMAQTRPDEVIVVSKDCTHDHYIVRSMELGCDVVTEKPMTTDEKKCRNIIDAQRKTGRKCRVTFNCRYSPQRAQVKDLLMQGIVGDILSVDMHWHLNTSHGADYFRRWHSNKANSGGLMVHKATHHFDLVNWWLSDVPASVFGEGKREFYTPKTADRLGLSGHGERCLTCCYKDTCGFSLDMNLPKFRSHMKTLYLDNEQYDGYLRDRCVFRPEIDIEDTMNVVVKYKTGTTLCYSLNAFSALEGYHIAFNGTKGRLEHQMMETSHIMGDGTVPGAIKMEGTYTHVYPLRSEAYQVELWSGEGGHGGGDPLLLQDIFAPDMLGDPYNRAADQRSGAYSILIGAAANISFKTNMPVKINDLVQNIGMPDYPQMPSRTDPIPMPKGHA